MNTSSLTSTDSRRGARLDYPQRQPKLLLYELRTGAAREAVDGPRLLHDVEPERPASVFDLGGSSSSVISATAAADAALSERAPLLPGGRPPLQPMDQAQQGGERANELVDACAEYTGDKLPYRIDVRYETEAGGFDGK